MQSLELPQPNTIIFRLPDDDEGNCTFAEVAIVDGVLAEDAEAFGVGEDDSLNDLEYSTVVLALREDDETTLELGSFDITDRATGDPAVIWESMDLLPDVVPLLIAAYNGSAGHTLQ